MIFDHSAIIILFFKIFCFFCAFYLYLFRWPVPARASVMIFFAGFVVLGFAEPMLILFGVVDLLGAAWTGLALRAS